MTEPCKLRAAVGIHTHCDEETCVYWRAVDHLDVDSEGAGCAIEHFQLLEGGEEVATWLLSVKSRIEGGDTSPDGV